jgi:transposase
MHISWAELLYLDKLQPVYYGEHGARTLKELVRSYLTISKDVARVMTRVKALYRSWAIPCTGKQVYAPCYRAEWLAKLTEPGVRRRAEFYYQQLDALRSLRREVRRELLEESKKHKASKLLRQIPSIGLTRAAVLIGILQTPHRFRTKRQLWTFIGLGIEMHSSADHRMNLRFCWSYRYDPVLSLMVLATPRTPLLASVTSPYERFVNLAARIRRKNLYNLEVFSR